jgi:SAM-dependent methyltransferase
MNGSDPGEYWEQRLEREFDLHGVGHQGLGRQYNTWLYRVRRSAFGRLVSRLPADVPTEDVLDIGSGTGFYIDLWRRHGARSVTGVDITDVAVRRLSGQFPDCRFFRADIGADELPVPGETFGIASAFDVLFHIVDDLRFERAFLNVAAQLRPGGLFVISEHLIHRPPQRTTYEVIRPMVDVLDAAEAAGFRVIDRFPVFSVMNSPIDSRSRARVTAWKAMTAPARLNETCGWLNGAVLYPAEWLLTRLRRESTSTEMLVMRKPDRRSRLGDE